MSKSLQHRAYRTQPKYQLSKANLPHNQSKKNISRTAPITQPKPPKSKITYQEEFQFIKKLISKSKIGYNWKLLNPRKLGYILVSSWTPQSKGKDHLETRSGSLTWGYRNPKDGFIYVGNRTESWKLGKSQSYYHPSYGDYFSESFDVFTKLANPLLV